jgi:MerR family mercuric resistance operon transcriptional regulator
MTGNGRLMTIGQVSRATGVADTTLRYYEREGILAPTVRSAASYRLYDADAVARLEFIRSAQALGFTLDDIRVVLDADEGGSTSCRAEVQRLIERRLAEVDLKMKDLKRIRTSLSDALARCRRSNGQCEVVKGLRRNT